MEKAKHSIRFESEVQKDGSVQFKKYVDALQMNPGDKVTVNIFGGTISKDLARIFATEEEIEIIGTTQYEDRENIITFLSSQGTLTDAKTFRKRIEKILR